MTYEATPNSAHRLLHLQLVKQREAQLKADCKALLNGGHLTSRKITQSDNGHTGIAGRSEETYRPQDAAGLLATDYALDDYNTWK